MKPRPWRSSAVSSPSSVFGGRPSWRTPAPQPSASSPVIDGPAAGVVLFEIFVRRVEGVQFGDNALDRGEHPVERPLHPETKRVAAVGVREGMRRRMLL